MESYSKKDRKDKSGKIDIDKVLRFVKGHLRYFAAGALFFVMILVLATCMGDKEGGQPGSSGSVVAEEYEVDAHEDVNALIEQYYTAYAAGDITTLTAIAAPVSANEQSYISMFSQFVEEYQNITCYTKNGLENGSYLVSVAMEIKFTGVDTSAPGLDFFYVRTNESGTLYIDNLYSQYNLSNQENALDTSIQNLIYGFENKEEFVNLQSEVQERFDAAIASDESLSAMIYTTVPEAIDVWVAQKSEQVAADGTDVSAEPTEIPGEADGSTEAAGEDTETVQEPEEDTADEPAVAETYYTTDKVNVRAEASTDGERLGSVEKGAEVQVVGIADDWATVKYDGREGYIKAEYLTKETSDAQAEDNDASADEALSQGTVITLSDTVNIRSGMSETSDKVGTAYKGEKVKVVMSYAEGWTKVTWNNKTGYIKSSLLQ